ncbi:uncharacterized protein LOC115900419 [Rhinopithecus roxellana]|uniref:uncharacterized protein LOC115900419 n=1 Tax=Rhinopithecus roxellana TaxID=61622 RepID=UPI00123789FA|nr:uncharacterized protein LOC115900419 [Rhinopithecus roxellana]
MVPKASCSKKRWRKQQQEEQEAGPPAAMAPHYLAVPRGGTGPLEGLQEEASISLTTALTVSLKTTRPCHLFTGRVSPGDRPRVRGRQRERAPPPKDALALLQGRSWSEPAAGGFGELSQGRAARRISRRLSPGLQFLWPTAPSPPGPPNCKPRPEGGCSQEGGAWCPQGAGAKFRAACWAGRWRPRLQVLPVRRLRARERRALRSAKTESKRAQAAGPISLPPFDQLLWNISTLPCRLPCDCWKSSSVQTTVGTVRLRPPPLHRHQLP